MEAVIGAARWMKERRTRSDILAVVFWITRREAAFNCTSLVVVSGGASVDYFVSTGPSGWYDFYGKDNLDIFVLHRDGSWTTEA